MTPDTSRWKSTSDYTYIDDLVAPDLAWEWLRRNEGYQDDYRQSQTALALPAAADSRVRREWGLEFFRPAVFDGRTGHHLLVA